jgi:hypothetical protein
MAREYAAATHAGTALRCLCMNVALIAAEPLRLTIGTFAGAIHAKESGVMPGKRLLAKRRASDAKGTTCRAIQA